MRITVDSPISGPNAFVLERLHAHEELGRSYRYDLNVHSASRNINLSSLLGETAAVHVEIQPGVTRHFHGFISRAWSLGSDGRNARYRLELRPWVSLLQHSATCRIWQDVTVLDVLKDVCSKAGFSLNVASITIPAGRQFEYVVQYRESDYAFFMRLLEQEGYYYYVRHEENKHEIFLTDALLDHDTASEELRFAFQPPSQNQKLVDDTFNQWQLSERLRSTIYELDDYNFKEARGDLFARSATAAKTPSSGNVGSEHEDLAAVVYDYPGEYAAVSDGDALTAVRQQELRVDRQLVYAGGDVRSIGAGSVFKLFGHPVTTQNAQYAVTEMDLTIDAAAGESGRGSGEFVFRGTYTLINTALPYRLRRLTAKPTIPGAQTAVVVGPKGDEIHTDNFGRVRVKFRWDRTGLESHKDGNQGEEALAPEDSSCWIRVMQPWASSGFGFQFIPRIGDEVVVQFLEGDPDRPLIIGSVYNNVNPPPYAVPGKKTQSGIKTRSSKQGGADNANEIRFEDEKGAEELYVQAERNQTVKVKASRSLSVGGSESHTVAGTRDVTITKKNSDTYKAEHKMEVTGKQTIKVMNDKSEYVDLGYELSTKGKYLLTQGAEPGSGTNMKLEGDAFDLEVVGPMTIKRGTSTITIDEAGIVTVDSAVNVVLKCGGNLVELSVSGVSVTGTTVLINT